VFSPVSYTARYVRITLFPIKPSEEHLYKMYKQAVASFWTPEEIPFAKDIGGLGEADPEEQHFIKQVLAFFAGSDGIVQENLASPGFSARWTRRWSSCSTPSRTRWRASIARRTSLLIDTYVKDKQEQDTSLQCH
jgi:hypothetical protein